MFPDDDSVLKFSYFEFKSLKQVKQVKSSPTGRHPHRGQPVMNCNKNNGKSFLHETFRTNYLYLTISKQKKQENFSHPLEDLLVGGIFEIVNFW